MPFPPSMAQQFSHQRLRWSLHFYFFTYLLDSGVILRRGKINGDPELPSLLQKSTLFYVFWILTPPGGSDGEESAWDAGGLSSNPWVREIPLEKGMAAHSSLLAWRISWTEEPGGLQSMGSQRVRHSWATHTFTFMYYLSKTNITDFE